MINRKEYENLPTHTKLTPNKIKGTDEPTSSRPTVLHCGISSPTYSSVAISNGWRQNGFDVSYFNWQSLRFDTGIEGMRERLLIKCATEKPEIIFLHIQHAGVIDVDTAKELSENSFVINYTFDVRGKEKTEWMYELAPHIGLTVFSCQDDYEEALIRGMTNVSFSHSSCDMEIFRPLNLPQQKKEGVPEIVFIGNNTSRSNLNFEQAHGRVSMVEFLQKEFGEKFGVYGIGWPNSKVINAQDKINVYNSCRIAITQNQFKRKNYCSDRVWEIMSCGAFALCEYHKGIENDLIKEVHCDTWKNLEELKSLINFYLENDEERIAIAKVGSSYVRENHTWQNRISQILEQAKVNGLH